MTGKSPLCNIVYVMLLLVLVLQSLFYPNFILSEEHHYLEVALDMYYRHHWLLLEDTSGAYLSKPPLLFWMLSILWKLLGAHTWVIHLFLLVVLAAVLFLTQYWSWLLFEDEQQAKLSAVIVFGSFVFFARGTVFCFDILVVLFVVLSAVGVTLALKKRYVLGFMVYGISMGLGVLTKGPIILAFCLPFFAVATFFRRDYGVRDIIWFSGFLASVFIATIFVMDWLMPVLHQLRPMQRRMLLLRRGLGVKYTYGQEPFYFYLKTCLLLFMPWLLWPYGMKSLFYSLKNLNNPAFKIVFYSLLLSLIILSIIPPKALRYVMSSVVLFAMLYAYALCQNKPVFNLQSDGTHRLLRVSLGIVILVEIITLCFPDWVMSKMTYPAITYAWVIFFESVVVVLGGALAVLPKRDVMFEALRLSSFVFVLVLAMVILPHEVLSKKFAYQAFVTYVNDLKKQGIPIIYCRAYGGYQYSMMGAQLPMARYALTTSESKRYDFVYVIVGINNDWVGHQDYFYRIVDPSQGSAMFVRKIPATELVGLSLKEQRC